MTGRVRWERAQSIRVLAVAAALAVAGCSSPAASTAGSRVLTAPSSATPHGTGEPSALNTAVPSPGSSPVLTSRPGLNKSHGPTVGPSAAPDPASTGGRASVSRSNPAGSTRVVGTPNPLPTDIGTEASGLARSSTIPGGFWVVDDATGTDTVAAVDSRGRLLAQVTVGGMDAANAEALTQATCEYGSCLYVGDIGDNSARRADVTIFRIAEPARGATSATAEAWHYRYPDGPHNAESMIVDGNRILIITKPNAGKAAHRLYSGAAGGGELILVRTFRPPAPEHPLQSAFTGTVATDASFDGHRVLLLTYDQVIAYVAPAGPVDPADFPRWPHQELPMPQLDQAEGITGLADGCGYAVVSEAGPLGAESAMAVVRCR